MINTTFTETLNKVKNIAQSLEIRDLEKLELLIKEASILYNKIDNTIRSPECEVNFHKSQLQYFNEWIQEEGWSEMNNNGTDLYYVLIREMDKPLFILNSQSISESNILNAIESLGIEIKVKDVFTDDITVKTILCKFDDNTIEQLRATLSSLSKDPSEDIVVIGFDNLDYVLGVDYESTFMACYARDNMNNYSWFNEQLLLDE